jgi:uncharacterized membrane protein
VYEERELCVALADQLSALKDAQAKSAAGLEEAERQLARLQMVLAHRKPCAEPVSPPRNDEEFGFENGPSQTAKVPTDAPADIPTDAAPKPSHPAPARRASPRRAPRPDESKPAFEQTFGRNWLLIAGVIIMVFGVGYFLKYSFEQGWVSPTMRVLMAYVWGLVFLGGGELFRRKGYRNYGLTVAGGGVAVLYFATFAAYRIYELIPSLPAFGLMILTTALAISLAVIYDVLALAALGLAGGFLTPVLLSSGQDRPLALFSYLTLLNAGVLATAFVKRWPLLAQLGFIATYIVYGAWWDTRFAPEKFAVAFVFLQLFFLIYALIPFLYELRENEASAGAGKSAFLGLANGFAAFAFSYSMLEPYGMRWAALLSCAYAGAYLALAAQLARRGLREGPGFALMLGNASLYLSLAIPLLLSGAWITLFWAAQAAALLWIGVRLDRKLLLGAGHALLALTLGKFFFYDYGMVFGLHQSSVGLSDVYFKSGYGHMLLARWLNTLALALVLTLAPRWFKGRGILGQPLLEGEPSLLGAGLPVFLFLTLSLECNAFFHQVLPGARAASLSVLWSLFSIGLLVAGFRLRIKNLRIAALSLFAFTAVKVVLVDMAQAATPYRIVSSILLGAALVGASFLYHRLRDRAQPPTPESSREVAP